MSGVFNLYANNIGALQHHTHVTFFFFLDFVARSKKVIEIECGGI